LPIVASKREHQKGNVTLLDETYLASPSNDYETVRFPWFNGSEFDDWLMIYNPTSNDITVEVYIGGTSPIQTTTVNANSRKELWYHNVGGRVMVKNITNTDDIIVSKRTKRGFIPMATKWSVNDVGYNFDDSFINNVPNLSGWQEAVHNAAYAWSSSGAKINYYMTNAPKGYIYADWYNFTNALARAWSDGYIGWIKFDLAKPWSLEGLQGTYDVQSAAAHEFGHWTSLFDQQEAIDADKTMHIPLAPGTIYKRTLFNTDKMGAKCSYGKKGNR